MTDPLISEYLPVIRGHIVKKYRWMETRGNCLLTVDDLVQVASIALVRLVARWDLFLADEGKTRDGNGGMFWSFLEHEVKQDVYKYYERVAKAHRAADSSADDIEENYQNYPEHIRTALWRLQNPSLTQKGVAAFFDTLPQRDKILIALRYFDELPFKQVADVLAGYEKTVKNMTGRIVTRWRVFARNQILDVVSEVPRRVEWAWEPPQSLHDYVEARHRMGLSEYLGIVTLCFRADVSYLVDILKTAPTEVPGARKTSLSPYQQHQVDEMIADGVNMREISRRLNVPYAPVLNHAKRRRSSVDSAA